MGAYDKYHLDRIAADGQVKADTAITVMAILLMGGTTNSQLEVTNDDDGSGTAVINVKVLAADTRLFDFTSLGGIWFSTEAYFDISGTSAEAYIWWT